MILSVLATGLAAQEFDRAKMDSLFTLIEAHDRGMGSISIFKEGREIYQRSIGFASIEQDIRADAETKYRIGSVSKIFTATLIMQLVEEGKLELDTKLEGYFPAIEHADRITIRHLLKHQSGIFNITAVEDYTEWMEKPVTREELVGRIIDLGTVFQPGEKTGYSNSNYVLLSFIAEKTGGKQYPEILQERIIRPCGLKNTRYGSLIDPENNEARSYVMVGEWTPATETHMSVPAGAGGIISTPTDLNLFLDCLFNEKLVSDRTLEQMKEIENGRGIGMARFSFFEKTAYGHTGGIDGFQSMAAFFPDENISIAYSSNGAVMSRNKILIGALSIYFGREYDLPEFKEAIEVDPAVLEQYTGVYSSPELPLKITFIIEDGTLTAQATAQPAFPLEAYDIHRFRYDPAGIKIDFIPEENKLILKQAGTAFEMTRELTIVE